MRVDVRSVARSLLVAATLPLAACGSGGGAGSGDGDAVEYAAHDFATGAEVDLASLRGRPVLLSSWASWCPPCERELPELERLHQTHVDDLQVVVVNVDEEEVDPSDLAATIERHDLTMPIWRDASGGFVETFRGVGFPIHALIDADGRVAETWIGVIDPDGAAFRDALARVT